MKRILGLAVATILALIMTATTFADIDLSGMTYDELVALKDQINLAIWNSEEWQEVEVPQGVWEVGADIPAGKWEIRPLQGATTAIYTGTRLSETGTPLGGRGVASWK